MTKRTKSQVAILKAAKDCFWKYGINKVTVAEICEKAGVSKMTYYRNFANKKVVSIMVLKDVISRSQQLYDEIMSKEIDFPNKIKEVIVLEHEFSRGISQEFIQDVTNNEDEELRQLMVEANEKGQQKFIHHMKEAQREGWVRKDLHFPFLIHMMNDINIKLRDEKLIAMYDSLEDLIMELVNFFFYGIVSHEKLK
ncbi:TetR/AcrR family transcriptional regulator [Cyclobacterium sp. 1_MG-2023]|uniref:TetR/AcrR family transcriptional regulator n=1 Tax=Cyclobacterium sp. 1_MG-2023 TaxID=3062681 RepID=UPI0026E330A8|nr:TetR/AcrR family transcriptional regulator [Cyclobacterium sp. 1_MG-2023]MDO6435966.1 TetR/AcrR family transcriptional regulator [Cyclobacterium sp. 1_MG-2023]